MFGLPHKAVNGVGGAGEQAGLTSRILANEPGAAIKLSGGNTDYIGLSF